MARRLIAGGGGTRVGGALLCGVLLSCGSVPKASPVLDLQAKAFQSPSDAARIYVYRLGKPWLALLGRYDSRILIDSESADGGILLGAISKRSYLYADVSAGKHTVTAVTLIYDDGYFKDIARKTISFNVVEGSIYFVHVEVPGNSPGNPPEMRLVSTAEGMEAVRDCQLAGR